MRDYSAQANDPRIKKIRAPSDYTPRVKVQKGTAVAAVAVALALSTTLSDTFRPADRSETNSAFARARRAPVISERAAALYQEVASYATLKAGWDGEGSVAPPPAVIASALAFLGLLPANVKLPHSTVSADGEVGYFWKSPGVYIDIGFPTRSRISYYAEAHGLIARGAGPFDGSTISQELLDVISRA